MKIHEVCGQTGLTKKAINWYIQQGLLQVETSPNGYRNFDDADVSRLREIRLLRHLDIPAKDIKRILDNAEKAPLLREMRAQKQQESSEIQQKMNLFDKLIKEYSIIYAEDAALQANDASPVMEKLALAFPGFWGAYLARHFGPYLGEPLQTEKQKEALRQVITWLDEAEFKLPLLARLLQRLDKGKVEWQQMNATRELNKIIYAGKEEQARFVETVRRQRERGKKWYVRILPQIAAIRHNNKVMRKRLEAIGYYDDFIPKMRIVSQKYDEYCTRLEALEQRATA